MSPDDPHQRLAAEQRARVLIDRQLADAGWSVQDKKDLNLSANNPCPNVSIIATLRLSS